MSDNLKLWEIEKILGGDKDPFETPIGPTNECLSANQVANYVRDENKDSKILKHISKCSSCSNRIATLKKLIKKD